MGRKDTETTEPEARPRLICEGIWGGIRNLDQDLSAGGVRASLYSLSCDGGKGGDIYYFGVCRGDKVTRLAIADVVGHGQAVSDVSQHVYESLKAHMCDLDSRTILSDINQRVSGHGLQAMTTAAVVAYDAGRGEACVSCAGHPPVLFKRLTDRSWSFIVPHDGAVEGDRAHRDLPLAVAEDAIYGQMAIPMSCGDRLFVYTDGVTEAPGPEGQQFGGRRLNDVLDANADATLSELKSSVLRALRRHAGRELTHDDVTLIALEISSARDGVDEGHC